MGTTAEKLTYLNETKTKLYAALQKAGLVSFDSTTTFRDLAERINLEYSDLYADFGEEKYKEVATIKTFSDFFVHSRGTLATMTDSDGFIKWGPHNLARYSQEFEGAEWTTAASSVNDNQGVAPDGTATAALFGPNVGTVNAYIAQPSVGLEGLPCTMALWVKSNGATWVRLTNKSAANNKAYFNLSTGTVGTVVGGSASITDVGDGWYFIKFDVTSWAVSAFTDYIFGITDANNTVTHTSDGTNKAYIWGAHTYRSDLGGMVDNPDRGDSYVPTTTSAVYLPRRGHHVYNGYEWVNEGLLHESEARTNLITYSNDFTNASWLNFNADSLIVTADQANGSDGSASLDKIEITDSTSEKHFLYFSNSITQGQNYSISCELKNGDQRYVSLGMYDSVSRWFVAVFDLQNGTVTQESDGGADATIQSSGAVDLGGGLYRCYVVGSIVNGDSSGYTYIQSVSSGTPTFDTQGGETYSAVGGEYFYAGKIQREAALDNISVREINPLSVSIQMDGRMTYADEGSAATGFFFKWLYDNNNLIQIRLDTDSGSGDVLFTQGIGGVYDSVELTSALSPDILVPYNIASRHGSTFINGAVDGTALTANTTPTALPDLSSTDLSLGHTTWVQSRPSACWDRDLTDTGIAEATAPSLEPSLSLSFDSTNSSFVDLGWSE
jgi:hypothetical protein